MDFLPPDKIAYGKSSPSMGFRPPPPLPKQIAHAVPILHREFVLEEICHIGGTWDFFRGGGGACHMVLFPPAMGFLPGKVCHMIFLHGESLPYGIISAGTISHGICSLIMKFVCVWGGGRFTIEGKLYHMALFPPWGSSVMGFLSGEGNACLGIEQIHDNA